MDIEVGGVRIHHVEHGAGRPVLVLHGAGVDHREAEACFEPALAGVPGLRRIYPDLPGMGRSTAPEWLDSAEGVVEVLLDFADVACGGVPYLLIGHSAGGYFARAMAQRRPSRVAGLALVCPLLDGARDVPGPRLVEGAGDLGDEVFRSYFVIRTPAMLERYERFVAPAAALADQAAMERIGANWALDGGTPHPGPTLVVAGLLDSTVGWSAAVDYAGTCSSATLAVLDGAGHALPHERPGLMGPLLEDWCARVAKAG